jgi:cytochrome c-type biogenesis protein
VIAVGVAFLAGVLTTLNPCVLPMLPLVLSGAFAESRMGPAALAFGLVTSFSIVGLGIAAAGPALGVDPDGVRMVAAAALLASGFVMVHGPAQTWLARVLAPIAQRADQTLGRRTLRGSGGQFAVGLLLGAVWSPCVGPTLGAATALAMQGADLGRTGLVLVAFGTGMAAALLVVAYGLRGLVARRAGTLSRIGSTARRVFGWSLVAVGVLIVSGIDKAIEAALTSVMPAWLLALTTRF